jgi:hypothetical protein
MNFFRRKHFDIDDFNDLDGLDTSCSFQDDDPLPDDNTFVAYTKKETVIYKNTDDMFEYISIDNKSRSKNCMLVNKKNVSGISMEDYYIEPPFFSLKNFSDPVYSYKIIIEEYTGKELHIGGLSKSEALRLYNFVSSKLRK